MREAFRRSLQEDGRMCLCDVMGKGRKERTLPVPLWAQPMIDAWKAVCRDPEPIGNKKWNNLLSINNRDPEKITGGLSVDGIVMITKRYCAELGLRRSVAPHDLRRTLAKLLRDSGAPLEQIQHTLGHTSIQTTAIYLGSDLKLAAGEASVDKLPFVMCDQKLLLREEERRLPLVEAANEN